MSPYPCGKPTKSGVPCKKKCVGTFDSCYVHKDPCACCFEPMKRVCEVVAGACGHTFHRECLVAWTVAETDSNKMIKSCPMCRGPLHETFQWPKKVKAGRVVWDIRDAQHARSFISAIEKTGRTVSDDMEQKQAEAIVSIADQIGGIDGIDWSRKAELADTAIPGVADGIFTYKFFMTQPFALTILVESLSSFNLLFNLTVLKGHLQNLVV